MTSKPKTKTVKLLFSLRFTGGRRTYTSSGLLFRLGA
jgi:hypothetical protein